VIKLELKDFGKGKDAEADECTYVTAKFDGSGRRGIVSFEQLEGEEYDLGDSLNLTVEMRQQKLGLKGRARAGAEAH
jgi:hypothetical protein